MMKWLTQEDEHASWKHTTRTVMFIVPMLMLILITCYGYKLTATVKYTQTSNSEDGYIALLFGVVTVIFGLVYIIIGLTIVADLALDIIAWLQHEDMGTRNEGKEQTTKCEILVHTLTITVSMFMLAWTVYYGYKLAAAARAQEVVIYNRLTFLIGVITMAFGFIYFIIGIGILAESALLLPGKLHQVVAKSDVLLESQDEMNLEV